jgi:hypothetical protein
VAGLRGRIGRIRRRAEEDAVIIRLRDGSVRTFDRTRVMGELYLARLDAALGRKPRASEFLDALANATPESRRAVEALASEAGAHYEDLDENDSDDEPEDLSEP